MSKVTDSEIIRAAQNALSATGAAAALGIRYETYKRHATRLGVFATNASGKGRSKPKSEAVKIQLDEILAGQHPQYQTYKLKLRLLDSGKIVNVCDECFLSEWRGKPLNVQLDHIDGNKYNHKWDNLRMLCPNCHSQTDTYCGRNKVH